MKIKNDYYYEFSEIESTLSKNLANRGLDKVKLNGQLKDCVASLNQSHTVVIVTGFAIKEAEIGETDGPPGALALAYALECLNKKVVLVTDKYSEAFVKIGADALNLNALIYIFEENKENEQSDEIIEKFKPDHIIGIERPGRNCHGRCHSMSGEDITHLCPNTDALFLKAQKYNIATSAIGDGGNEIGMGKIKGLIHQHVYKGKLICAEVETDHLIITGVSNWGAYGICSALSITNNEMLLIEEDLYEFILKEMVQAGAVDGCSKKCETTVDGLSYEENLDVFLKLRTIALEGIGAKLKEAN